MGCQKASLFLKGETCMANNKRYDSKRRLLKKGEQQRADGYYVYRWTDRRGVRHSVNAKTLEELREKEDEILKNSLDGIRSDVANATVNDVYELWWWNPA